MTSYPRVIKFAADQPWALKPAALAVLADVLKLRSEGHRFTEEEIRDRIKEYGAVRPNAHTQQYYDPEKDETFSPRYDEGGSFLGYRGDATGAPMQNGRATVAIINVFGMITQRADALSEMSGAASIESLQSRFIQARDDASVSAIVMRFDTPGGGVYGVEEFAKVIFDARSAKPIFASADAEACSAGFWLFGACGTRSMTPSGGLGSLGVYSLHEDLSKLAENEGVKYTFVSAGKYKTEGNPFEPLSEEAAAFMQQRVDEYYATFKKAVAKFYGISVSKVESDFGQGRVFGADQALAAGMVDRVEPFQETLRRAVKSKAPANAERVSPPTPGPSPWDELNAAHIEAQDLEYGARK